ncbi:MAG: hypothetical protein ISS23_00375 [Nanoarchaeota archaeon]|nr:hypothetical protein [Nanoarchaeota archaeon]
MKNFYAKVSEYVNKVGDCILAVLICLTLIILITKYWFQLLVLLVIYIIISNRIKKKNSNKDECNKKG